MKARVWQGNPELYKQRSKIDYFATEDEKTKGYAFYQRGEDGKFVFKGASTKFDLERELKEIVPNIKPVKVDLFIGNYNEFKAGKGRIFVSGDFSSVTDKQTKEYYYVYNDSTGKIQKLEFTEGMTSNDLVNTISEGYLYGGYYVTDIKPNGDTSNLEDYDETNAATGPCSLQKNKVYFVHEIPLDNVLLAVRYGEDFTFMVWKDPEESFFTNPCIKVQRESTEVSLTPEIAESVSITTRDTTPDIRTWSAPSGYKIYLFKEDNLCSPEEAENGITITLLDGTTGIVPVEKAADAEEWSQYYLSTQ